METSADNEQAEQNISHSAGKDSKTISSSMVLPNRHIKASQEEVKIYDMSDSSSDNHEPTTCNSVNSIDSSHSTDNLDMSDDEYFGAPPFDDIEISNALRSSTHSYDDLF